MRTSCGIVAAIRITFKRGKSAAVRLPRVNAFRGWICFRSSIVPSFPEEVVVAVGIRSLSAKGEARFLVSEQRRGRLRPGLSDARQDQRREAPLQGRSLIHINAPIESASLVVRIRRRMANAPLREGASMKDRFVPTVVPILIAMDLVAVTIRAVS